MAGATALQAAVLASPAFRISNRARVSHFFPTPYVPQLRRSSYRINTSIKCMAEGDEKLQEKQKIQQTQPEPVTTPPASAAAAKVSTKFSDVLAFSGPAPERINGRLAMIGFVAALAVELSNGQDVLDQISNGGITWFLGTSIVLSLASLIPLFKGVSVESKSDGFMTSDAELWNGRFAMLGLVALAFTEYVKGGALV
ncbi:early light-induced protein, chloroplastic [Manihot esculenta]|uniref:Uncharacterized protein n=1 Tax=Manihot esculenta TaxID=3983 RepID=A0A2C9UCR7_MANES|nr:early light-induced protein, chloroplastic [Manihot esculenta]OAY28002.1 hypothetical protein MANES_15G033100v8 [Manihot esculenta]